MTQANHGTLDIIRRRRGQGFEYLYQSGKKLKDSRVRKRIEKLVIPPNWRDVRINKNATADLQATGIDVKGRKQYLYHDNWHKRRQAEKFEKLSLFGEGLCEFRQRCWSLVNQDDWTFERSLALVCLLLDHTGIRAGNVQYTKSNQTYGLTTLRRKHLQLEKKGVSFSFIGKRSKERHVNIHDPTLANLVAESAEQPGYALFRYEDDGGRWHDVTSDDVNAFIHDEFDSSFSCKDFRTWGASRFALLSLPDVEKEILGHHSKKWPSTLTRHVSGMLGNTPTICRQYYLHPRLLEMVEAEKERQIALKYMARFDPEHRHSDDSISATETFLRQVINGKVVAI